MIIRTILALALGIAPFWLSLRLNMHMFQLNGYKNGEHLHWMKKNLRLQWILIFAMVLGLLRLAFPCLALDILGYLTLYVIFLVYRALKRMNNKKKLVYTARVKRMIATILLVTGAVLGLSVALLDVSRWNGVIFLLVGLQLCMNLLANVINHPIEAGINRHYVNDAKRKLHSVPNLQVIGVTGSYGKTSVKFYLKTLLQEKYDVLMTPESYNTPMGVVRTIRESLKSTNQIFICEMGARHVGDIKEICDIVHPDHGIITSVGPQHLETFFNMENIKNTKFELADALPEDGMLFLNGDCDYIQEKAATGYKNRTFYYASDAASDAASGYSASDITVSQMGTEFTVTSPEGESERFQMRLIGAHNVINVVGAIAVANRLGISLHDLRIPVRRIQSVPHRMELREHGSFTIIDDAYNSNPVGSKAAVETLSMFAGTRILITPGMVELGDSEEEYNYKFGTYAADCCDYILLVGPKHTKPIYQGIIAKGFPEKRVQVFDKFEDAMNFAVSIKAEDHKYILLENDLPDNY